MTESRTRIDLRPLRVARGSLFIGCVLAGCVLASATGCGRQVDLGGGADGGNVEASVTDPLGKDCEPCETTADCERGTLCSRVAGHLYCATKCTTSAQCEPDETCAPLVTSAGPKADVCAPSVVGCSAAAPPTTDGARLDACGSLIAPHVVSVCRACEHDCQPNGCYGGYWCEPSTRRCRRPPPRCP